MQWWTVLQLKSKDAQTRREAAEKLAATEDDGAVSPLLAALDNPDPEVRKIALKSLGKRQEERVAKPAQQALRDADPEIRTAACVALENLGNDSVIPDLIYLLRDDYTAVRWQAARTLNSLNWRPSSDAERALLLVAQGKYDKAAAYGPSAIEPLMLALKDLAFYKRMQAIEALTRISDARVVKPLVSALRDSDGHVRTAAVEALGELGDPGAVDPLLAALKDPDGNVRAAAIAALRKIGDPRCVDKLIPLLKDENYDVRAAAVDALGRLKDSRAITPLIAQLKDRDRDIRQGVVAALGYQGDERAITALVLMLKDQHVPVRETALVALVRIDREWAKTEHARLAIPELQAALRDKEYWVRQAAEEALLRLGVERPAAAEPTIGITDSTRQARQTAVELLLRLLGDSDRDLRQASAEALGRVGEPKAIDPLVGLFQDGDEWVRRSAAGALGQLNWKPDDAQLRARQVVILQEWEAAIELGPAAVEPLLGALRQRDNATRLAVIDALARIGDTRAAPAFVTALGDTPRGIRQAAARALRTIRWQPENESQRAAQLVELELWDKVAECGPAAVEPLINTFHELTTTPEELAPVTSSLLKIVESNAEIVPEEPLQTIASLEEIEFGDDGAWSESGGNAPASDLAYLRQLARQELARRGIEV